MVVDKGGNEKGLELGKRKDHFIFSIESVGQVPAPDLFERALVKLKEKCQTAKDVIHQRRQETG
ncbi:polr1c [Symbiodinium sp. CCMP2456]|nr:polr1c [Symbiodinium sp. CCMP2456]